MEYKYYKIKNKININLRTLLNFDKKIGVSDLNHSRGKRKKLVSENIMFTFWQN